MERGDWARSAAEIGFPTAMHCAFLAVLPSVAAICASSAPVPPLIRRHFPPLLATAALHPAVEGWPEKYSGTNNIAPLHTEFAVQTADYSLLMELDVSNWPTWTTAGNDRWLENVTRKDKEMPYGELSYLVSGKLEIIPKDTGVAVIVNPGDFVTFPEGFVSDWTVLEELTWHYYLY